MSAEVSAARRRRLVPQVVVVIAAFLLSGCTGSVGGRAGGTGGVSGAAAGSTGAASGGTGGSSGADAGAGSSSGGAGSSEEAPQGDGIWHPQVRAAADTPAVPDAVTQLLTGLTVDSVMGGSASAMSDYPYTVTVDGTCQAARASMAKQASAADLTVTAQGAATLPSTSAGSAVDAEWLVVSGDAGAGADLSLVQSDDGATCSISGVGFTPVLLSLTGPVAGDVTAFTAVTCAQPFDGASVVGIWAAPVGDAGGKTVTIMAMGEGPGGPGSYAVGSAGSDDSDSDDDDDDDGDDEGGFFTQEPQYGYASMSVGGFAKAVANSSDDDDDADEDILPPGARTLSGTVTMARGMASGTLDLTGGGEHITGSFECGTPVAQDE